MSAREEAPAPCKSCNGSGMDAGSRFNRCPDCSEEAPPAREDAQPFMFAYENVDKPGEWRAFRQQIRRADGSICPGRALYTHPAPEVT